MDTLLLLLLLVALAGGATGLWWLRGRMQRLEDHLHGFAPLSLVPDRLHALGRTLEKLDPERLRADVDHLRAQLKRIEALVAVPAETPAAASAEPRRHEVVRALVTRHLQALDYRAVAVLHEDEELAGDELTLRVEATRNGLRIAGTVEVAGDQVAGVKLEPSYTMFP